MYLNLNYQNVKVADYNRLLRMYNSALTFNDTKMVRLIRVRMYILDKLIKKGELVG